MDNYVPKQVKESNRNVYYIKQKIFRPRRLSFLERKIVAEQVERWIEEGIVEPCSTEYANPVVVTRKKDGTPRICVDYRAINRIVVKDCYYPLFLIEDILDRL